MKYSVLMIVGAAAVSVFCYQSQVFAGAYLSSAHGSKTHGVNRTTTKNYGYAQGNCAHCHEQHDSIRSSSLPNPAGDTPSPFLLFYNNYVSQTDGLCFECHTEGAAAQDGGGILNRSYSYRAGAWTAIDPLNINDVKEAFAFTSSPSYPSSSSHNLADIRSFVTQPSRATWRYNSSSNPCVACHDPHAVQGDPASAVNSSKTSTRGWLVSLPSQHGSSPWGQWGDEPGEKMSDYTGNYQAPYRFGGLVAGYEPDGSMAQNGSNLTDFNTFCMDCHNSTNVVTSTLLGGSLRTINWTTGDRHGQPTGTPTATPLLAPYTNPIPTNYVLACTDCHEPHGSPNIYLIRKEVNNGVVSVDGGPQLTTGTQWASLCERCHGNATAVGSSHHAIMGADPCTSCHPTGSDSVPCTNCHYHGSSAIVGGTVYRTF